MAMWTDVFVEADAAGRLYLASGECHLVAALSVHKAIT